jgi:hypothetical protein
VLAGVTAVVILAAPAYAVTIYTYTGNPIPGSIIVEREVIPGAFVAGGAVTGWFTVDSPLPTSMVNFAFTPTDFSFSDTKFTYTPENTLFQREFRASTNASGGLNAWFVELQDINPLSTSLDPLVVYHFLLFQTLVNVRENARHAVCVPADVTVASCGVNFDDRFTNDSFFREGTPSRGTWTMATVSAPEPSMLPLLLMSLAGVGILRFRKQ